MDYVEQNKSTATNQISKRDIANAAKAKQVKYAGPKQARPAGQIPKYLVERKIEMEVDKAMAEDAERRKHAG